MAYQARQNRPPPTSHHNAYGSPPPINDLGLSESLRTMREQADRIRLEGDEHLARVLSHSRTPSQEPRASTTSRTSPSISRTHSRRTDKGKGKAVAPVPATDDGTRRLPEKNDPDEEALMQALELSKQTAEFDRRARLEEEFLMGRNHGTHQRGESSSSAHSRGPSGSSSSSWWSGGSSDSRQSGSDRVDTAHDEEIARALAEEWHVEDVQEAKLHHGGRHYQHQGKDHPSSRKERREPEREDTVTVDKSRSRPLPDLPSQDTTPKAKPAAAPSRREEPHRSSRPREQRDHTTVTPRHIPVTMNPPPFPQPSFPLPPTAPQAPVSFAVDPALSPLPLTIQIAPFPDFSAPPPPPPKPSPSNPSPVTPYSQHSSSSGRPSLYSSAEEGSTHASSYHGRHSSHRSQSIVRPSNQSGSTSGSLSSVSSRNTLSTESSLTSTPPSSPIEHHHRQTSSTSARSRVGSAARPPRATPPSNVAKHQAAYTSQAPTAAPTTKSTRSRDRTAPKPGNGFVEERSTHTASSRPPAGYHVEYVRKPTGVERVVSPIVANPAMINNPPPPQVTNSRSANGSEYNGTGHSRGPSTTTHIDTQSRSSASRSGHSRNSSTTAPTDNQSRSSASSPTGLDADQRPTIVSELSKFQRIFTGKRRCLNCDHRVKSPDKLPMVFPMRCITSQPIIMMLHVSCSACDTVYCRGCYRETRCTPNCLGEYPCPILNPCCLSIPALAIFEILSAFDSIYLADPSLIKPATQESRAMFNDYIMAKGPKGATREVKISEITPLEKAFFRTLESLHGWLPRIRHDGKPHLHPAIIHLFASSFFMEVLQRFLERDNEWYWIFHHETYASIVKFLQTVIECGLTTFITSPFPQIYESAGIHEHVWGRREIVWHIDRNTGRVLEREGLTASGMVDKLKTKRDTLVGRKAQTRLPEWVKGMESIVDGLNFFLVSAIVS
ncbi:hypothetical protein BDN72DRAFT_841006 [Pluteus cervinus]|uniref:Uncharacterized protein n=1 Tax=Pluteus cervinus TaxID=181527 RepID=A0ACD3AU07_9AGAR|nr:hypothetical protein BDN72DRAFT_841006 [Pluteus cervinus]